MRKNYKHDASKKIWMQGEGCSSIMGGAENKWSNLGLKGERRAGLAANGSGLTHEPWVGSGGV